MAVDALRQTVGVNLFYQPVPIRYSNSSLDEASHFTPDTNPKQFTPYRLNRAHEIDQNILPYLGEHVVLSADQERRQVVIRFDHPDETSTEYAVGFPEGATTVNLYLPENGIRRDRPHLREPENPPTTAFWIGTALLY